MQARDVHGRDVHGRDVHGRDVYERDVYEREVHLRGLHWCEDRRAEALREKHNCLKPRVGTKELKRRRKQLKGDTREKNSGGEYIRDKFKRKS